MADRPIHGLIFETFSRDRSILVRNRRDLEVQVFPQAQRAELLAKKELARIKFIQLKQEQEFEHQAKERALEQKYIEEERALKQKCINKQRALEQKCIQEERALEQKLIEEERALKQKCIDEQRALEQKRIDEERALQQSRREPNAKENALKPKGDEKS